MAPLAITSQLNTYTDVPEPLGLIGEILREVS